MRPYLDIDPQDGDIDLLQDIERIFELRLSSADTMHWRTVGDIHDTLIKKVDPGTTTGACPTAMTFNRLRAGLAAEGLPRAELSPAASLSALAAGNFRALWRKLAKSSGLELPRLGLTYIGNAGCLLLFISAVSGLILVAEGNWLAGALSAITASLGIAAVSLDKCTVRNGMVTLGDLARATAALNRQALKAAGGRQMPSEIWEALTTIASEHSGVPMTEMSRDTFLFRKVWEAEAA